MSEVTGCRQSADSAARKRCPSPDQDEGKEVPCKSTKVCDEANEAGLTAESCRNSEAESKEGEGSEKAAAEQEKRGSDGTSAPPVNNSRAASNSEKPQSSDAHGSAHAPEHASAQGSAQGSTHGSTHGSAHAKEGTEKPAKHRPPPPLDQSDSAAIAAAEALASLTGGDGEDSQETPCSSEKAKQVKQGSKFKQRGGHQSSRAGSKTQAAAADSSTSVHSTDREDADDMPEADEGDESMSGSSSTPSSSFPSDNEDNDDGECAIVSVKMAPEMRQSVALLAQVQMRLEALEKKSARLHQRLELKISRQRRPHLDQRSSITKTIPGFWVTAVSLK